MFLYFLVCSSFLWLVKMVVVLSFLSTIIPGVVVFFAGVVVFLAARTGMAAGTIGATA